MGTPTTANGSCVPGMMTMFRRRIAAREFATTVSPASTRLVSCDFFGGGRGCRSRMRFPFSYM
jgi:hypothetical protein